jgi:hypothetical protein
MCLRFIHSRAIRVNQEMYLNWTWSELRPDECEYPYMDWIGIFEIASLLSYWENLVIVQPSSIFGPTQWQRDQRQEERVTEVPAPLLEFLGA